MLPKCKGFVALPSLSRIGRSHQVSLGNRNRVVFSRHTRLLSAVSNGDTNARKSLLHNELESLGIDATVLHASNVQAIQDPTKGYSNAFGKPAIKTYRAFIKQEQEPKDLLQIQSAAGRCARQVEFLVKRHKAAQAEWVRHLDDASVQRKTFPLMLVLDNVRSALNVGSLFRTADATGCSKVITTGITPHPGGSGADKLQKSALGAEQVVPHLHFGTIQDTIDYLRTNEETSGYSIIGMETTDQSKLYTSLDYSKLLQPPSEQESGGGGGGVALILGNEVTGVDPEIMPLLDNVVEIPMYGAKNSLNIAACAPVMLYEILRQWDTAEGEHEK